MSSPYPFGTPVDHAGSSYNARSSMSGGVAGGSSQRSGSKQPPKPSKSTPRMSPVEVLYRRFWSRKGDVFHLLMSLGLILDDRCARWLCVLLCPSCPCGPVAGASPHRKWSWREDQYGAEVRICLRCSASLNLPRW